MGACSSDQIPSKNLAPSVINEQAFEQLELIGEGGFAKVYKVRYKHDGKIYAMKIQSKLNIAKRKQTRAVIKEREILGELLHQWLYIFSTEAFQTEYDLYIIMHLLDGGDLRYYMKARQAQIGPNTPIFSHEQTQFIAACTILALNHIHDRNIIHRDIKPENLILDQLGYLRVGDFGISQFRKIDNSNDNSGTIGYIAPEVICMQNHSFGVDYFALGIILYEIVMNGRPYNAFSRNELREKYLDSQAEIKQDQIPKGWCQDGIDFINILLQRKPNQRQPFDKVTGKVIEMQKHPWFEEFSWINLENQIIVSPLLSIFKEREEKIKGEKIEVEKIKVEGTNQQQVINEQIEEQWAEKTVKDLIGNQRFQQLFEHYEYNSHILPFSQQVKASIISKPEKPEAKIKPKKQLDLQLLPKVDQKKQ